MIYNGLELACKHVHFQYRPYTKRAVLTYPLEKGKRPCRFVDRKCNQRVVCASSSVDKMPIGRHVQVGIASVTSTVAWFALRLAWYTAL